MKDKEIKVLCLARDKYPPFRPDVEGLFGKVLPQKGYAIDWLLTSEKACAKSYKTTWNGGDVWVGKRPLRTSGFGKIVGIAQNLFNDLKVFKLLKQEGYDFVQVKDKYFCCIFAILATKIYGGKFIFWVSYPYDIEAYEFSKRTNGIRAFILRAKALYLKFIMKKIIAKYAAHIFVQSAKMKENYSAIGIPEDHMTPVPMGVNFSELASGTFPHMEIEEGLIVYLGTLAQSRKLDFLIRAFKQVKNKSPKARLLLIGAGEKLEDEEFIRTYSNSIGVGRDIEITGFLPRAEAWQRLRSASVCVSPIAPNPILDCGSPTKLVEYMANEKASVCNDNPDQKHLIEESGGGICVSYNEGDFAEAIEVLLGDPMTCAEMGLKGRRYVEEKRNYHSIADIVDGAYRGLVA